MPAEIETGTETTGAGTEESGTAAGASAAAPTVQELRAKRVAKALVRYRAIAYTVGVGLRALTVATILDWGFHIPQYAAIVGPLHGFLYMIYLALGIDLALKARWSVVGTLLVLLCGTIPFLSFVAERQVTKRVTAGRKL
jgi:integral membrane protein